MTLRYLPHWDKRGGNVFRCLVVVLIAALVSSGCATLGAPKTQVNYYPACYEPLDNLRAAEKSIQVHTITGAIIGAVVGAGIGYLIGGGRGAAIGGAGGALAGGAVGYFTAKNKNIADAKVRYESYGVDIKEDISTMEFAVMSAKTSQNCYDQRFKDLIRDIKSKRIGKKEAYARFAEIQSGTQEASEVLGAIAEKMQKRGQQYSEALAAEAKQAGTTMEDLEPIAAQHKAAWATDMANEKRKPKKKRTQPDVGDVKPLARGAKGSEVLALQKDLKALHYYRGSLDGDFGPKMETAVQRFQQDNHLKVSGIMDKDSYQELRERLATHAEAAQAGDKIKSARTPGTLADVGGGYQLFQDNLTNVTQLHEAMDEKVKAEADILKAAMGDMEARRNRNGWGWSLARQKS